RENSGGHLVRLFPVDSVGGIVRGGSVLYGMILQKGIQFRSPNHDAASMLHAPEVSFTDRLHVRAPFERERALVDPFLVVSTDLEQGADVVVDRLEERSRRHLAS